MPIIKDLTIAILTCQRPNELKLCLNSIHHQSSQPKMILVIDSDVEKTNIPQSRNLAINRCKTRYLVFIDDDCIAHKKWLVSAYEAIKSNPSASFIVGNTISLNYHHQVAKVQYDDYKAWFDTHHPLDTKNLILDLKKINNLRFDTSFDIFEDVDFGLQLKSQGLSGSYCPKMKVSHPDVTVLNKAIMKSYRRGLYKAKITEKWGNYDNYQPRITWTSNPLSLIVKIAFILGYRHKRPRPIIIVNNIDKGANGDRAEAFKSFLQKNNQFVETVNSQGEFDKVIASKTNILIYGLPLIKYKIYKFINDRINIDQTSNLLFQTMLLRKIILHRLITSLNSSLAIIQYPEDMMVCLSNNRHYKTLYDSPTIYFRELELTKKYSTLAINQLKQIESNVYMHSDLVSFHWYSYLKLAKKYGFTVSHPIKLNWGCSTENVLAHFSKSTKVVHLGKLNSYWVNPPLINSLSEDIAIDFFSYEPPDKTLYPNLRHFKGYIPSLSTISKYNLGLITISKDDLRSAGFSAKYLMYLSFGLPVLCPEWRHDPLLAPATIYYNETNINEVLIKYQDQKLWQEKHLSAIRIAKKLSWDETLTPLLTIRHEHTK